jgi:hypothetical protein
MEVEQTSSAKKMKKKKKKKQKESSDSDWLHVLYLILKIIIIPWLYIFS